MGAHHVGMKRLRSFAAVWACLAVLASGFLSVAAIAAPAGAPATERSASTPPCSHCPDCDGDGMPCPMPSTSCLHIASNVAPILGASAIALPTIDLGKILWSAGTSILIGLSPPPDPFPPRV